jgi:hypothetical protein
MEHLLYCCEHYYGKTWDLAGKSLTLARSHHSGEYIPAVVLTPLEIVFNKPHPSILLHIPDATTRKVLILLLEEIKRDIVYRQAQLQEPRRCEELHPRIQAHLVSVIIRFLQCWNIKVLYNLRMVSLFCRGYPELFSMHEIPPHIRHPTHYTSYISFTSIPLAVLIWCKSKKKKINKLLVKPV